MVEGMPVGFFDPRCTFARVRGLDANDWELYHIAQDPVECRDLADQHPQKLREMVARWYVEAGKYKVLPLDATLMQRFAIERPRITKTRDRYTFYPDLSVVPIGNTPMTFNRPHSITAEVEIPAGGAEGVLLFGIEGLSCGYDFGEAVTHEYHVPFRFTGTIHKVTVDLSGELIEDDEATVRKLMAQQ
jgi:arylsulfatase